LGRVGVSVGNSVNVIEGIAVKVGVFIIVEVGTGGMGVEQPAIAAARVSHVASLNIWCILFHPFADFPV